MSPVEEAIASLTQIRSRLAPITELLLDIEARLAAAKAADIERPAKVSLREFTSNLLNQTQHHPPRTIKIEKYGSAPPISMPARYEPNVDSRSDRKEGIPTTWCLRSGCG
jgi:hypothetical protein